jgi:DNA-binding response OmpR family regulator
MERPTKAKVLFLDDDADTRELVAFTLNQADIEVVLPNTASEVLKLASSEDFDLFLLDGLIPDGDGFDLCRKLRKLFPSKPIVFYSGLAFKADIQKGIEAGADRYLIKPYYGDLAETILQTIAGEYSLREPAEPADMAFPLMNNRGGRIIRASNGIF